MPSLTRRNYQGPSIHQSATARSRQYPATQGEPIRELRASSAISQTTTQMQTKRDVSVEIYAEPLSSGDEELDAREDEEEDDRLPALTPRTRRLRDGLSKIDDDIVQQQQQKQQQQQRRGLERGNAAATSKKGKQSADSRRLRGKKQLANDPVEMILVPNDDDEEKAKAEGYMSDEEARVSSWMEPPPKRRMLSSKKYHSSANTIANIHSSPAAVAKESGFKPVPDAITPSRSGRLTRSTFNVPDELSSPPSTGPTPSGFTVPAELDLPVHRKRRSKLKDEEELVFKLPDEIPSPRSAKAISSTFQIPPDSTTTTTTATTISTTSSAATADQAPTIFSVPDSPALRRSRSLSASSLSSVDSIASLLLTQDEKDALTKPEPNQTTSSSSSPSTLTANCPLCNTPVPSFQLEEFTLRHTRPASLSDKRTPGFNPRLPHRLQQRFCLEHRAHTALSTWTSCGYPTIDWNDLSAHRITPHLPHLRAVLHNQAPSFYRDTLVEAMSAGKGRRSLLKYLKGGVLDVVKYGYYGPRGARVAAEVIMGGLAAEVKVVVDEVGGEMSGEGAGWVVREVGVGAFVQSVLVPELMGRWVAEDRGLRLEGDEWREEVRRVLEESSEVGRLLNEDEDRVIVKDQAGDGDVDLDLDM